MSHELRTPLNAIIGFSEVLQERMFGEHEREAGRVRQRHPRRRASTCSRSSTTSSTSRRSRPGAWSSTCRRSTCRRRSATRSRSCASARSARHRRSVARRSTSGIGEITADERKFKQILLNLLSNAVKFTPGRRQVDVRAAPARRRVEIAVTRHRASASRPRTTHAVFEEFRQVGSDYTQQGRGHGPRARARRASSSSCTAAASGSRASRARDRLSHFTLPDRDLGGAVDMAKRAGADRRGQRQEPQARAGRAAGEGLPHRRHRHRRGQASASRGSGGRR